MVLEPVEGHDRWLEDTDVVPGRRPTYFLDLPQQGLFGADRRLAGAAAYLWEHPDGGGPYVLVVPGIGTFDGDNPDGTWSDRNAAFLTAEGLLIARDEERRRRAPPPGLVVQRGLEAGGTGQAMFQAPPAARPRETPLLERERARQAQVRGPTARQDVLQELDRFEQDKKQRRLV